MHFCVFAVLCDFIGCIIMLLLIKWLPELRILTGYFTVQLMSYNCVIYDYCTANYIHYNIGYVIISITIVTIVTIVLLANVL